VRWNVSPLIGWSAAWASRGKRTPTTRLGPSRRWERIAAVAAQGVSNHVPPLVKSLGSSGSMSVTDVDEITKSRTCSADIG
jgi:hypothetical protein